MKAFVSFQLRISERAVSYIIDEIKAIVYVGKAYREPTQNG